MIVKMQAYLDLFLMFVEYQKSQNKLEVVGVHGGS